jgi:hypothetical protein
MVTTHAPSQQSSAAPYIDAVSVALMYADPTYQRDLDDARVETMAADFDQRLVGVLEVSAREDGRYAILDGQHRWATTCRAHPSGDDAHLVCQIHTGLSIEDEARVFYEIDARRKQLSWWDRWRARRGGGDPGVLAIDAVLARHGLQINPSARDGNIRATKAVESIVAELGDLKMLDRVLVVLTSAFGRAYDGYDGAIMQGVALVLAHYDEDEIDLDRLVTQLREVPPKQLRARAAALRELQRGTLPRLCAAVIVERYNGGRGRNIEQFFVRVPAVSKAGARFNQERKQRNAIRRWADRNGYDLTGSRNIPPAVRRAYEEAQVASDATNPSADDVSDVDEHEDTDQSPEQRVAETGVLEDTRQHIEQHIARGMTVTWVMNAYDLDYPTVKAIVDNMAA